MASAVDRPHGRPSASTSSIMTTPTCSAPSGLPAWNVLDLAIWKLAPESFGGGRGYIQRFKDAWVRHHRTTITTNALQHRIPAVLLAGVSWIEVGGDPTVVDSVAFEVRAFDWSGPKWIDDHLTITKDPSLTSFGPVSMQLRTAASTLGLDSSKLTTDDWRGLARCLESDVFNLWLVARHLRQLVEVDGTKDHSPILSSDEIRIVGARYNRGAALPLDEIRKNTSYGDFIVKNLTRFEGLLS
jgi:hypothetical protein